MPMIYYTGPVPGFDPDTSTPDVIIGTDLADNTLVTISCGPRMTYALATADPYSSKFYWTFPAFNIYGTPITATVGPLLYPPFDWMPECCAVRSDGWIIAPSAMVFELMNGGSDCFVDFVRVFRRAGDRVPFPQLHGARILAIALDADDNIIVGGDEYSNTTYCLRKYSADGETLLWSATNSSLAGTYAPLRALGYKCRIESVMVDTDGAIYVAGRRWINKDNFANYGFVAKYDEDGTELWAWIADIGFNVFSLVLHGGYLIASVFQYVSQSNGRDLLRFDKADGAILDYHPFVNDATPQGRDYALAINSAGTELHGIHRENSAGSGSVLRVWDITDLSAISSQETLSFDLDPWQKENFLLVPDDVRRTSYLLDVSQNAIFRCPRRIQIAVETQIPPIAIAMNLAPFDWQGDRYTLAPPLPLRLGVGIPALQREYAGALTLPEIYRATLSGTPDLTLAISSFSVRRDVSGVSLSVVSPITDSAQVDDILARASGTLTLWRGVRFLDGTEQLEPMLSVPLAGGIRYDMGAKAASATLSGETVEPIAPTVQTRTLRGISYRSESSGARRVRCAVDTFIRPGDTADLGGGETMTVADLVYNVSAFAASMEVAE